MERFYNFNEKEKYLNVLEEDINRKIVLLEDEKDWFRKLDLDLQQFLILLEDKRKRVDFVIEKFEVLKSEISELFILELNFKEELDDLRG